MKLFPFCRFVRLLTSSKKIQVQLSRDITVDEAMIPFKGRWGIKQYMKDKPHKLGIKSYVLVDAPTGSSTTFSATQERAPTKFTRKAFAPGKFWISLQTVTIKVTFYTLTITTRVLIFLRRCTLMIYTRLELPGCPAPDCSVHRTARRFYLSPIANSVGSHASSVL